MILPDNSRAKRLNFFESSDYYRRTNEIIDGINRSKKVKGLDKTNQVGANFAKASIFQVFKAFFYCLNRSTVDDKKRIVDHSAFNFKVVAKKSITRLNSSSEHDNT